MVYVIILNYLAYDIVAKIHHLDLVELVVQPRGEPEIALPVLSILK